MTAVICIHDAGQMYKYLSGRRVSSVREVFEYEENCSGSLITHDGTYGMQRI